MEEDDEDEDLFLWAEDFLLVIFLAAEFSQIHLITTVITIYSLQARIFSILYADCLLVGLY